MAAESGGSTKPVAVIILGADMVVTAQPATPIQLWLACLAAGYDLAVPATWGDELVAAECLRAVGTHPDPVAVMCSCPIVARAIGDGDTDLSAHLVSLVAPPVAAARYLRRVYGERRVHITFAGACPAAGDSAIDTWVTPPELLERFVVTGIELEQQPQLFESVLPPDRRRHLSQPGGVPTAERAAALARPRQLIEVGDIDVTAALRRHLMGGVRALVDVAPRLGCSCAGAVPGQSSADARRAVTMLEPPRSARPVMPDPGGLGLLRRAPPRAPQPVEPRPDDHPAPPIGGRPGGLREEARTVATSRPASRSPLSWNLRERALPQPPTSGSPPASFRGASSGGWTQLDGSMPSASGGTRQSESPTRTPASAEATAIDAATLAAAHALEAHAAHERAGGAGTAASAPADAASLGASQGGTGNAGVEPGAGPPGATASSGNESPAGEGSSAARGSRATPPGGYWFVAPPAAGSTDTEIEREPPVIEDSGGDVEPRAGGSAAEIDESSKGQSASGGAASGDELPPSGDDAPPSTSVGNSTEPGAAAQPMKSEPVDHDASPSDSVDGEPAARSRPSDPDEQPSHDGRDVDPPARGWVAAMIILLMLAGAMLARDAVHRRDGRMSVADVTRPFVATADVVLVIGAGVGGASSAALESLFDTPGASPPVTGVVGHVLGSR